MASCSRTQQGKRGSITDREGHRREARSSAADAIFSLPQGERSDRPARAPASLQKMGHISCNGAIRIVGFSVDKNTVSDDGDGEAGREAMGQGHPHGA